MKIVVLVKRVPDTASVFKIGGDGKSVDLSGLKFVMSPYDEHAVEEAIKLKEAGEAEIVVVSLGGVDAKETIRQGLAMGADRGVLVTGAGEGITSRGVAKALAAAVKRESPELIFAGKQAVDDDASQVPERVAEILGMPHASVVTRLVLSNGMAEVDREIEGGQYTVEMPLPALFSMEKGINTPRYPTLPNIMKAKKKPIDEVSLEELGLSAGDLASGLSVAGLSLPRQDRRNRILEGEPRDAAKALLKALREEDQVI
jgi:electron transfer flavoprotein beta subunit